MASEKMMALEENEEFISKMESAETEKEAAEVLRDYGVFDEVSTSTELTGEELTEVTGGFYCKVFKCYKCSCGKTFKTKYFMEWHWVLNPSHSVKATK